MRSDRSVEEIDAIFDAYAERGVEDLPPDMFFAIMHEIENEQHEQREHDDIEVESQDALQSANDLFWKRKSRQLKS